MIGRKSINHAIAFIISHSEDRIPAWGSYLKLVSQSDLSLHLYCQHRGPSWRTEGTLRLELCQEPATPAASQAMSIEMEKTGVIINLEGP